MPMHRLKRTKPEDALESAAEGEKRLGITAKTRKAAEQYGKPWTNGPSKTAIERAFLKGATWERRRRAKDGY